MSSFQSTISQGASRVIAQQIATGAGHYDRRKKLRSLLPLSPEDFRDTGPETTRAIIRQLARALRDERRRGRAGHWTYDLNRHLALAQAFKAEKASLPMQRVQ